MADLPLPVDLKARLDALSSTELAFIAGYAWARSQSHRLEQTEGTSVAGEFSTVAADSTNSTNESTASIVLRRVQILSASQTGNARRVAKALYERLAAAGMEARHSPMGDYDAKQIGGEDIVLVVTSTYGDGEPPEEALPLYKLLHGKNPPRLDGVDFAVLALGDRVFPCFCQAGKDFDDRLAKLGARRLLDCGQCDQDFHDTAETWSKNIVNLLGSMQAVDGEEPPQIADTAKESVGAAVAAGAGPYDRTHPYAARFLTRRKITARNSEKDVEHIEIDLGDSGLRYQPGDALGVWYENAPQLVADILNCNRLSGEERVQLDGDEISVVEALTRRLDITTSTPMLAQHYARLGGTGDLLSALADEDSNAALLRVNPPIALFHDYPYPLDAQTLVRLFRPLAPRMYSIASSQAKVGEAVHLCVRVLQYSHHGQIYTGGASGFLGQGIGEGDEVRVFIESNPRFRLPADGDTPILMIAAGVGIAPFRAFVQQREVNGDRGENWLIFGNTRFTQDFVYHAEWLKWRGDGLLTRADLAWSRDREEKVYVQHKLLDAAVDVWAYLQRGAHVYVCGDALRMAKGVEAALLDIIRTQGGMDEAAARDWLDGLRETGRYQRDVY